ncbi:major royal jelly protein 3-like [Cloeon dipterum]|uniref:major royal jelly protein 3-like n=1 Tax=Cloeon dipterum TaxID=197152 RepID=UPI00321FCEF8
MTPFFVTMFFLPLSSLATAANFTEVFEWPNKLDFEWPSEARRTQALRDGTFEQQKIEPVYMAVYGSRIFLSLEKYSYIPVSLVSLPTNSASSAPPNLTPFPSWDMHEYENCDKIEKARGLEVDSVGRLWLLDEGSPKCYSKLWIIDLSNDDKTKIIHRFPFLSSSMHDLVLEEAANGTFAYISRWGEQSIVVFSLERKQSWIVDTPRMEVYSIALSPKDEEPRKLYLGNWSSNGLYSISVATLRNGTRTAKPKLIGKWTSNKSYRMLMDNNGTIYAAFKWKNYISSLNTSQPFEEQRFHEVAGQDSYWPFTFVLDQNGTFWMTVFDFQRKPRCRLLEAAIGAKSYIIDASPVTPATATNPTLSRDTKLTPLTNLLHLFIIVVICSFVLIILWLILRQKMKIICVLENNGVVMVK